MAREASSAQGEADAHDPAGRDGAPAPSRARLRRTLRTARRALGHAAQQRAAHAVLRQVLRAPWFRRARRIGLYVADDGELDPAPLLNAARRRGKRAFLPTLPGEPATLAFAAYNVSTLAPRRFGIRAPRGRMLRAGRLDLLFVPLVAFDATGARLGRGGGFYDRALAPLPGRPRPLRVGLAHALQQVPALAAQHWDVHLDIIVTPNECIRARREG